MLHTLAKYWPDAPTGDEWPRWRQLAEMALLYVARSIGPGYYKQARWGRRAVPWADKWEHVNRREYRRALARLNPVAYRKASQHKLVEKAVLVAQGLPTAPLIGHAHPWRGRACDGSSLCSATDLVRVLSPCEGRRVCFKLVEGYGGHGFASYMVGRQGEDLTLRRSQDEAPQRVVDWWDEQTDHPDGFLIEEHLAQHPLLATLNPSSVNTVRMWTVATPTGGLTLGAYLRVGRHGAQVDNIASGGIACPVDVATGRVREAFLPAQPRSPLPRHPDSGVPLQGLVLPDWDRVLQLAGGAVAAFPHIRLAGLDMAFTPTGPVVIELNVCPDYIGCAWMDLPLRRALRPLGVWADGALPSTTAPAALPSKRPW